MTRREFAIKISQLILQMVKEGESPIFDYMLRSSEEQYRLFERKLSNCDGYRIKSNHQLGKAADIYLCDKEGNPQYVWDEIKAKYWHEIWATMGGKFMIVLKDNTQDRGHFEG